MNNVMEEVSRLQQRLAAAQREHNRAEGAYATAREIADRARAELMRDFGVDDLEQAGRLLDELKDQLAKIVTDLNTELDRIGVA